MYQVHRILVLIFLFVSTPAIGAVLVSEGVIYDASSGLYTYRYAVDNTSGTLPIVEVAVLVSPYHSVQVLLPHTSPLGWTFTAAIHSRNAHHDPPSGTFQVWSNSQGVAPGQFLSGFSITTSYPPGTSTTDNYRLLEQSGFFGLYGNVPAPQLPPVLPAAVPAMDVTRLLLLAASLALAGVSYLNRA